MSPWPWHRSACQWLLAVLVLRACAAQPQCAADCTKLGNCNSETGDCQCPYGRNGRACEIDMLSACRIDPNSPASCSIIPTTSCECKRQCEAYHCREGMCELYLAPTDRGCFTREGLPPERQTSTTPAEGEAGVAYYRGWKEDALRVDNSNTTAVKEVMRHNNEETVHLPQCKDSCNKRGFCIRDANRVDSEPGCRCHIGFLGAQCEVEDNSCYLGCNGHGKCKSKFFCHCEPPYFSLGCSRTAQPRTLQLSTAFPAPNRLKIYMYELSSSEAFHVEKELGEPHELLIGLYAAYIKFTEQFLVSPIRTLDPSEANLFFVPTPLYAYSKMNLDGNEHLHFLLTHLKANFPYWNRTDGKDHFFFAPADRGGCHLTDLALNAIKIVHFGYYWTDVKTARIITIRQRGHGDGYSCYHPQRDIVAVTHDNSHLAWAATSSNMSVDDIIAKKNKMLFFRGGSLADSTEPDYSGMSRQILDKLDRVWKDPEFDLLFIERGPPPADFDLETYFRRSKFCFAPYGWGFGNRLAQAIVCNCIPVIVQENVFQPYEDILPYEAFSIRLTNNDLPSIRELLGGISTEQYRGMMEALVRHRDAFHWWTESGGRAFDYTVASLRRRQMNLQSKYF